MKNVREIGIALTFIASLSGQVTDSKAAEFGSLRPECQGAVEGVIAQIKAGEITVSKPNAYFHNPELTQYQDELGDLGYNGINRPYSSTDPNDPTKRASDDFRGYFEGKGFALSQKGKGIPGAETSSLMVAVAKLCGVVIAGKTPQDAISTPAPQEDLPTIEDSQISQKEKIVKKLMENTEFIKNAKRIEEINKSPEGHIKELVVLTFESFSFMSVAKLEVEYEEIMDFIKEEPNKKLRESDLAEARKIQERKITGVSNFWKTQSENFIKEVRNGKITEFDVSKLSELLFNELVESGALQKDQKDTALNVIKYSFTSDSTIPNMYNHLITQVQNTQKAKKQ